MLLNYLGSRVMEFQTVKTGPELIKDMAIAGLPDGVYQVRVLVNNEDIYSSQIVIAR